jgi:hypothetical protein
LADSTPLGNLDVVIGADWSDLQSAIDDAIQAAQDGAEAIEAAFSGLDASGDIAETLAGIGTAAQSAAEDVSTFGQAAQDGSDGIEALGNAGDGAASSLGDIGDAASSAGSDVDDFASSTDSVGSSLDDVASSTDAASSSLDDLGSSADAASTGVDSIEASVSEASSAASDAASGLTDFGSAADSASSDVSDLGEAADPLGASLSDASTAASDASSSVDDLGSGMDAAVSSIDDAGASVDSLSAAVDPLAGSFDDAGSAASGAGGDIGGFGGDVEQAGESANEAEGGVEGLAEQFLALGEALAATEGLKEFGEEALQAYGTVQSVTIGLTQLTGSAEQADTVISEIKELAATQPFAFPEIAPTIQKMVALGVSADQIPGVMQAVANSAAATGNQFSNVANAFDRMTLSGTVNARSLVQLGVSTTQLGAAMGVTSDQVKAAFAAMDQTDRINALEAAMGQFAGAAEAQAQGIAGQWQLFQNAFEEVMVSVGEAITPVVSDILSFGRTVLTEVQGAIDTFNQLPEPIRDSVVVIGLLGAAIVPLTALISGAGFAIIGLQTAWTTADAIISKLSGDTARAAISQDALTVSQGEGAVAADALAASEAEVGVAGTGAAAGIGATAVAAGEGAVGAEALGGGLLAAGAATGVLEIAAVALGVALLGWGVYEAVTSSNSLGESVSGTADTVTNEGVPAVDALGTSASNFAVDVNTKAVPAVNQLATAMGNLPKTTTTTTTTFGALGQTTTTVTTGFNLLGNQVKQTSTQIQGGVSNVDQYGVSLTNTSGQMAEASVKGLALAAGLANVSSHFEASGEEVDDLAPGIQMLAEYWTKLNAAMAGSSQVQAQVAMGNTQIGVTQEAVDAGIQKLKTNQQNLNTTQQTNVAILSQLKSQLNDLTPGTAAYATQLQLIDAAQKNVNTSMGVTSTTAKGFKDTIDGVTQSMEQAQEKAQSSITVYQQVNDQFDAGTASLGLLDAAYKKAQTSAAAAGIAFASAAGEAAKQSIAFQQATATVQAQEGALGNLIIQYYAQVAAGQDTSDIQQQIALSYKAVESEVAKTGGTYENATAALIALNVQGNNSMSALTGQAAVWTGLAGTVNKTADQQQQMAAVFKTVQTDAAAVGLSVTAVGNSLIYSAAPGIKMNDTVQALLNTLNAAAIASGNFVIKNGALVPTLSAVADAASSSNAGIGGLNATVNSAGVIISGLGTVATTAAPKVASIGTAAQQAGPMIVNLNTNMDGVYESSFIGGPAIVTYANAIKGVGTVAQGAGPQIINLNKNMDGVYETAFTGAPIVTQFGSSLTSAGNAAKGAGPNIASVGTAVTGVAAIINGVRFDNWETGFFQTGGAATTAATQITNYGTASTDVGNILANVPMKADLAATAFTDVATAAAALPAKFTSVDGSISVMGDSIAQGTQGLITFQQQAQNTDGSISNITVSVTGLEDPLEVMGSQAQIAAKNVQTMGQYAMTCGDECGDLTDDVIGFTDAAGNAATGASDDASAFAAMGNAAETAAGQVNSLAQAAGSIQGGGMVGSGGSAGMPTDAAGLLSLYASMGAPADVIDNMAAALGYVQVGNNDFITDQEYVDQYNAAQGPNGNKLTYTDTGNAGGSFQITGPSGSTSTADTTAATEATTANTTAVTSNTTAVSAGTTATTASTSATTAATGSINLATGAYTANTTAVNSTLPAFSGLTASLNDVIVAGQTYTPVIAGVTDTTTLASNAIQANAAAFAQSTNATGESTEAQIEAMYEAEGFSQSMATAGAEAVLGLQNTTDATNSLFPVMNAFGQATSTLTDGLTGTSGLNPALSATTDALTGSSGLAAGIASTASALSGSSGLSSAAGMVFNALTGPSGLGSALGSVADAASQAASALKAVGTSGDLSGEVSSGTTYATENNIPTSPMPTSPPSGVTGAAAGAGEWVWDAATQAWVWQAGSAGASSSTGLTSTPIGPGSDATLANLTQSDVGTGLLEAQSDALAANQAAANQLTETFNDGATQANSLANGLSFAGTTISSTAQNLQVLDQGAQGLGETLQAVSIIGGQVYQTLLNSANPNLSTQLAQFAATGNPNAAIAPTLGAASYTLDASGYASGISGFIAGTATPDYGATGLEVGPPTPAITLAPVFNVGTVVGSNAAQQLVNMVMPQMVAQLRQAGVKI